MTEDVPLPFVPAEIDLRGLPFMPLDTARLIDSDLFAISSGDEFKAAVALWCKAWQQVPAGSLPNDDRILARLSGAGSKWHKVKTMALHGFILCSDGRLYHLVIAAKALEAWKHRVRQRERAAKRWEGRGDSAGDATAFPPDKPPDSHGNAAAYPAAMQGTVKGQGQKDDASASSGARKEKTDGRSSRGSRLSPDWQPSAEDRDFAATLELDPDAVAAEFRDYWSGVAGRHGVKLDWSGTYRNRCRELATRGPRRGTVQRLGPATGIAQGFADALRSGEGEPDPDRRPYQPPPIALLGGQRG